LSNWHSSGPPITRWADEVIAMQKISLAVVGHAGSVLAGGIMSAPHALAALAALGQPTRLDIFRILMRAEPDGLAAGVIADMLGCPSNTLSTHLSILARAGLVRGTREGRSIVYRVDVTGMRALLSFLVDDCCGGHPEVCGFLEKAGDPKCGCGPKRKSKPRGK